MKLKKMWIVLYSLLALTLVIFSPIGSTGADESSPVIDIAASPSGVLFDVSNIKPGDVMNRKVSIQNKGNKDFTYTTKADFKSGSDLLYNQLELHIQDENGSLYDGKLSEFKGFDPRSLAQKTQEDITFSVEFPWESGNEFQGLATKFTIEFSAEGVIPPGNGEPPTNDGDLPKTGESNPVWYYLSGIMLAGLGLGVLRKSLKGDRPSIRIKR
ncbi:TasA family protein [Alkalihalobacillus sp. AL-G]|uniref:TasA family protein n=1 Tax=Alkalihalobacillus sp. AL-G TaxID=2926399 RepID=UPI00272C17D8|nr:TasA family protein [Alkalihalobacillus sp. AL-G]WLD91511.1 LPXTG cell wall anchor domain-containing protein [Alkalihalobacillus sp. AL-G]